MPDTKNISFDYDGTLSTENAQRLASHFINAGYTVHIITQRSPERSKEVYAVADKLGIPRERVHFTSGANKWQTVRRLQISKHYDNDPHQIELINRNTAAQGILWR